MRLQTQSPMTPATAPLVSKPPVRDLTSTLMENQLKQMSVPTPNWTPPKQITSPTSSSSASFGAFQSTPALSWGGAPNTMLSGNQWSGLSNMNQSNVPPGVSLPTVPAATSVNNGWSLAASSPRPAAPFVGSNLMGNSAMANLMSHQQMSSPSSLSATNTQAKPLSASEINDLLS